jgi:hypothetical protein
VVINESNDRAESVRLKPLSVAIASISSVLFTNAPGSGGVNDARSLCAAADTRRHAGRQDHAAESGQRRGSSGQGWPRSDRRKPTIWMITRWDSPGGRRQRSCRPPTVMAPRPSESSPPQARPPSLPRCRRVGDTNARTDATGATGCALTAGDAASWVWSEVWTEVWTWSPHQRGFSPPPPQGFAWGC